MPTIMPISSAMMTGRLRAQMALAWCKAFVVAWPILLARDARAAVQMPNLASDDFQAVLIVRRTRLNTLGRSGPAGAGAAGVAPRSKVISWGLEKSSSTVVRTA